MKERGGNRIRNNVDLILAKRRGETIDPCQTEPCPKLDPVKLECKDERGMIPGIEGLECPMQKGVIVTLPLISYEVAAK